MVKLCYIDQVEEALLQQKSHLVRETRQHNSSDTHHRDNIFGRVCTSLFLGTGFYPPRCMVIILVVVLVLVLIKDHLIIKRTLTTRHPYTRDPFLHQNLWRLY